jgi:hypothetical protein
MNHYAVLNGADGQTVEGGFIYRDVAQWRRIRRRIREQGVPKKQVSRETGISRRTRRYLGIDLNETSMGLAAERIAEGP